MDYIFSQHFTVTAARFLFSELQIPALHAFIIQPITNYQNHVLLLHQDHSLSEFTIGTSSLTAAIFFSPHDHLILHHAISST